MQRVMQLETCPYDGSPIQAESFSGGSVLLSCAHCDAAWEWHNAWVRRVQPPDRARLALPVGESRPAEAAVEIS